MKRRFFAALSQLLFVVLSAACSARNNDLNISNLRTALDKDGTNATSTFSRSDVIYAIVDLVRVPRGTRLEVKWVAVNAEGTERNHEFDSQSIDITDELFTGTTFFQLSNAAPWPVGKYRADLYVNDALAESIEFNVQ